MMRVSSWPAGPTKGRPWRSSSAPGPSPMNIRSASGLPVPKTTVRRPSARRQRVQAEASVPTWARRAARSAGRHGRRRGRGRSDGRRRRGRRSRRARRNHGRRRRSCSAGRAARRGLRRRRVDLLPTDPLQVLEHRGEVGVHARSVAAATAGRPARCGSESAKRSSSAAGELLLRLPRQPQRLAVAAEDGDLVPVAAEADVGARDVVGDQEVRRPCAAASPPRCAAARRSRRRSRRRDARRAERRARRGCRGSPPARRCGVPASFLSLRRAAVLGR